MASQELLEWCSRHGVVVQGIKSGLVAEGWRGVLATEDLAPDTCILRVPQRLLLTAQSARRDPQLCAALDQAGQHLSSNQVLAIHLLHELSKGQGSFWWPYFRSLPHAYATAMCFRPEDVGSLQVPYAQAAVERAVEAAVGQWRGALPVLRALGLEPKWLSKQAWLWAASTLSSRTMYVPFDPAGALTPFGDLHNYGPPPPPITPQLAPPVRTQQQQQQQQLQQERCGLTQKQDSQLRGQGPTDDALGQQLSRLSTTGSEAGGGTSLRISRPLAGFGRLPSSQQPSAEGASRGDAAAAAAAAGTASGPVGRTFTAAAQGDGGSEEGHCLPPPAGTAPQEQPRRQQDQPPPQQQLGSALDSRLLEPGEGCSETRVEAREVSAGGRQEADEWPPCPAQAPPAAQPPLRQPPCGGGCRAVGSSGAGPDPRPLLPPEGRQQQVMQQQQQQQEQEQGKQQQQQHGDQRQGEVSEPAQQLSGDGSLDEQGGPAQQLHGDGSLDDQADPDQQLCGDGSLDEQAEEYRIYARRRYSAGEQVFLCYGRHSNLELLEHYGFVLPCNPHDTAPLPPHTLPPEAAAKLPGGGLVEGEAGGCYVHANGAPAWELLRVLRLACASAAERRSAAYLALQDRPMSAASEARALGALRGACATALRALPTTAQEDESLLQSLGSEDQGPAAGLGECGRLAVEWRLGYKRALLRCIALCDEVLLQG